MIENRGPCDKNRDPVIERMALAVKWKPVNRQQIKINNIRIGRREADVFLYADESIL